MSLDALLAAWQNHRPGGQGPHERVLLWQNDSCLVAIDDAMGPMVPYPAVIHENGEMNHGYRSLKGDAAAIEQVPELKRFPEFAGFIGAINHADSPIESVGCENGFFDAEGQDVAKKMIGSYVDVVFSDVERNASPENFLHLAAWLLTPVEGCVAWWGGVEFLLQRLRGLGGIGEPWGLMIRIQNHGRDEDEARRWWGETLARLTDAISRLPRNFPDSPIAP
jgi:hypothetical protein